MTLPVSVSGSPTWQMCRLRWDIRDWLGESPAVAAVTFTSSRPYVKCGGSTLVEAFPAASFRDGKMVNAFTGEEWIDVPATEDIDVNPKDFTITARVDFEGRSRPPLTATFTTPVGGDLQLTSFVDLQSSSSGGIAEPIIGRGIVSVTSVGTVATITYTDGSTSTFTLPAGGSATTDAGQLTAGTLADERLSSAARANLARAAGSVQTVNGNAPDGAGNVAVAGGGTTDAGDLTGTLAPARIADTSLPNAKLSIAAQTSLAKADASVQKVNGLGPDSSGNVTVAATATAVQYVQQNTSGTWPARPTSSTTVLVFWKSIPSGTAPPEVTSGTGGMLRGVDIWVRVPA